MLSTSEGNLKTKIRKETDGLTIELFLNVLLSEDELNQLKVYRENFGKASPIHFHFNNKDYLFSQTKYFKLNQYLENPVAFDEIENEFLKIVTDTLTKFKNYLKFEKLSSSEFDKKVELKITD